MGLLESLVNVPEQLRIWHLSGIRYLFLPDNPAPATDHPATRPSAADMEPTSWPAPWAALFAKTPRTPQLVISYAALGLDLSGQGDKRRGNLWRRLIADLGLTGRGRVAFWPFSLPSSDSGLCACPLIFRAGLSLLAPNMLAFFGDPAVDGVPFDAPASEVPTVGGIRCVALPDPQTLLAGDQELWDHVLRCLTHG